MVGLYPPYLPRRAKFLRKEDSFGNISKISFLSVRSERVRSMSDKNV